MPAIIVRDAAAEDLAEIEAPGFGFEPADELVGSMGIPIVQLRAAVAA